MPCVSAILIHILDSQVFLLPQDVPYTAYSKNGTHDKQVLTDVCRLLITESLDRLR